MRIWAWRAALGSLGILLVAAGTAGLAATHGPAFRGLGILGGSMGLALILASRDPFKHWPILLQSALACLAAPAALPRGPAFWPLAALAIGGAAFFLWLLKQTWDHAAAKAEAERKPLRQALEEAVTQRGENLSTLSHQNPLLIVFLRHFGCTFCREACAELSKMRPSLEARGTRLVLVHMGTEQEAQAFFAQYGLEEVDRVGDRVRWLYRAFGLRRGKLWQLLGPKVWLRGVRAGVLNGHGIGRLEGDALQMPGVFLVHHDEMLRSHVHRDAADRPDYAQLSLCPTHSSECC